MFKSSAKAFHKPLSLATAAMMTAMYVVLYAVKVPIAPESRITLTFVPLAASAYLLGPFGAAVVGVLGDLLGCVFFPQGAYFPGFTLSSMLTGFVYGMFFYRAVSGIRIRVILCVIFSGVFINIGLNTLWLAILYKKAYFVYLTSRFVKNLIELPFRAIIIMIIPDILNRTGITKKYF